MAQSGQSGSGSSSAAQRELADQVEQMKRQLQQLTRNEQQRQQLNDAMQKLQDAANAMRQAAANGSKDGGAQAAAALDKLRQAESKLNRNQGDVPCPLDQLNITLAGASRLRKVHREGAENFLVPRNNRLRPRSA